MTTTSTQNGTGIALALALVSWLGFAAGCDSDSTCAGQACDDAGSVADASDGIEGGEASTDRDAETGLDACVDVERPELAACLQGPGINEQGRLLYDDPLKLDIQASVVAVGKGQPPDPCFGYAGPGAIGQLGAYIDDADRLTEARWATLEQADGTRFTMGALAPGEKPLELAVGDALKVSFRYRAGGFTPTWASLTVRAAKSGALRYWFGQGDAADEIETPEELSLKAGPAICRDENDCIEGFVRRDMAVEVGEQSARLPYAGRVDLEELRVVSGGLEEQTGDSLCTDAFVAWAAAAAWPRP